MKRSIFAGAVWLAASLAQPAFAHHGWAWAEASDSELSSTIVAAQLGNPHGVLTVQAEGGQRWAVEVGQPWRNERAGLQDAMMAKGTRITVRGHRHADPAKRVFKAERVVIGERTFDLYPDRE